MIIGIKVFVDAFRVVFLATPVAYAVFVIVLTIGSKSAAGVGAKVRGLNEMMLCVCFVPAHITDTVVHTGMLAPRISFTVGAVPGMTVLVVSIRSVGMLAVEASPPAKSAYISFSDMGFHIAQDSHTAIALFDMTFASPRVVCCIFMLAIIWFDIATLACVVGVVTVRFMSRDFCLAVYAPYGMPVRTY